MRSSLPLQRLGWMALFAGACLAAAPVRGDRMATIERVKASVVAIGTFESTRAPQFQFLGTGFAVGDGSLIATNAHVLPPLLDAAKMETLVVMPSGTSKDSAQVREVKRVSVDTGYDLALLKLQGAPLPPLTLREPETVREGQEILITGYPIGAVLGPFPATHRGIVSVVTPIAIPQGRAGDLDGRTVRRLSAGSFPVFQLDATAYPGNSGSPVYDPDSAEVLAIVNKVLVSGTKEAVLSQPSGITYAVPANHLRDLLKTVH